MWTKGSPAESPQKTQQRGGKTSNQHGKGKRKGPAKKGKGAVQQLKEEESGRIFSPADKRGITDCTIPQEKRLY